MWVLCQRASTPIRRLPILISRTIEHHRSCRSITRAALRLAQLNEARLAIVYASDLVAQTTVHKVALVPEEAHEPIIYTIGLLSQNSTQAADTFADFLTSIPALEVFYHFGFTPLR